MRAISRTVWCALVLALAATGSYQAAPRTWHDVLNTGDTELKLYSLYAPPEHPRETVHHTKADAEAAEH